VQLVRLSFNHPVKELVWCYTNPNASATANLNAMWNFCTATGNVNVTSNVLALQASNNYVMPNVTGVPQLVSTAGTQTNTFGLGGTANFSGNAYWIEQGTQFLGGTGPGVEVGPLHLFKVILNGQDRFKEQYGNYFNQVQPFYHHTGTPYPGIYVYSFALQPEEHQPTGTCNFSRIDNAQVSVQMKSNNAATLQKLFAVNYNILRIQSGMGGLAFSN
jgi:hypothetical protein